MFLDIHAVVVLLLSKIHFVTLSQLRMTRKYSLISTQKNTTKQKQRKCDSIEIHVVTMCFLLDAKTDTKLNKITALSLSLRLGSFLVCP